MNDKDRPAGEDFLLMGPKMEDGTQAAIRHKEDHTLEMAEIHPVEDGKSLPEGAEILNLSGNGPIYKVDSAYKNEISDSRKGPAKVVSNNYRSGWDEIFGKKNPHDLN